MSLREALDRRKKESPQTLPPAADIAFGSRPCVGLRLRRWNRTAWAFPWAHYAGAQFQTDAALGADSIRLTFGSNEVTLRGRNLDILLEPIAGQIVEEFNETPENLAPLADAKSDAPIIFEISVCKR